KMLMKSKDRKVSSPLSKSGCLASSSPALASSRVTTVGHENPDSNQGVFPPIYAFVFHDPPSPCILGTHHEKGAQTFWSVVNRLPLSSNAVLCWKFCHVFHKLLRDGHPNSPPNVSIDALLSFLSQKGHLSEGYGQLCSVYLRLLRTKMEYHTKNPRFPGNLQMSDRQLDEAGESDVNNFFQLTVEMFDYLECELNLFQTVFNSLDMSRSVSVTTAGQCRLAPLIQVILDCSHLYDYTVKLLFKLHSCLPADTLQGHRDRFMEQFTKLKDLFYRSSNLQYFKRLIQIPQLPENPPNFLRASALSEHISPVVVIPAEASSPDSEPVLEKDDLVDMDNLFDNKFDDIFGSSFSSDPFNFNSQNGVNKDEKDHLIGQLYRDVSELKAQLENMKTESQRAVLQLKGRVSELEAELAEQRHLRQQAADDSEFLRAELDELKKKREDTEKAQRSLTEIERRAQANEQRYSKLKEKYSELVQNHADLLRKVGPCTVRRPHTTGGTAALCPHQILGSCTSLMQAIQVLIVASKDLQREIVESGRGTASPKEFYAKNSRWTEGLISASKAVGWGATVMVDAADLVVQGRGKFEELLVCSHEIAASTAQLVAASKVKADKDSPNLAQLQQASRGVNQATATVVASTISGKSQIEETDNMDFSSMTLTQIKRQEMDSQVRVLELENDLQKERQKLGELRKKHYELAGVAEGWEEGGPEGQRGCHEGGLL
uniref:Huntingtin interacting protein 1 n=1 Tax=Ursus maritimus TaxID=29073 RepID=A0A452UCH7_URSMA